MQIKMVFFINNSDFITIMSVLLSFSTIMSVLLSSLLSSSASLLSSLPSFSFSSFFFYRTIPSSALFSSSPSLRSFPPLRSPPALCIRQDWRIGRRLRSSLSPFFSVHFSRIVARTDRAHWGFSLSLASGSDPDIFWGTFWVILDKYKKNIVFQAPKFAYIKIFAYLCTAKFALGPPTDANEARPVGRAEASVLPLRLPQILICGKRRKHDNYICYIVT